MGAKTGVANRFGVSSVSMSLPSREPRGGFRYLLRLHGHG